MKEKLREIFEQSAKTLNIYAAAHRDKDSVSYTAYIRLARQERVKTIRSKRIIYLDTMAWKCLADYKQGKRERLTAANIVFALAMEDAVKSKKFVFPIGLTTFFELDSMTDPKTHESLSNFVDELCLGFCFAPFSEVLLDEMQRVLSSKMDIEVDPLEQLVSPVEIVGIPEIEFPPDLFGGDEVAYKKAFYDVVCQLPFSTQLLIAQESPDKKWNNKYQVEELNNNKILHQDEIVNLNTGIFVELKGIVEGCLLELGQHVDAGQIAMLTGMIMLYWKERPTSKSISSMRVLASLHGLFRFDRNRKYHSGDMADFMAAASALPVASAMFTDRKLAIVLQDKSINLKQFTQCDVVHGFEAMAQYLHTSLTA